MLLSDVDGGLFIVNASPLASVPIPAVGPGAVSLLVLALLTASLIVLRREELAMNGRAHR